MSTLNATRTRRPTRIKTHEGGDGRKAEVREELAMLALSSFLGDSFYENSNDTLKRMQNLVAKAPKSFVTQLARVVRKEFNMRATPAALVGFYTLEHGQPQDGRVARDVFFRGDEIGDYLGTVASFSDKGKVIPSAVRFARSVLQDGMTERKALRYNNFSRKWNLAKIIRLAHARADATDSQKALFDFILLWRGEGSMSAAWEKLPSEQRDLLPTIAKAVSGEDAGEVSWERSRSAGADWVTLVDTMGYMALLRNLRNFLEDESLSGNLEFWNKVCARISDESEVAKSKQLPFRFLSAYRAINPIRNRYSYTNSTDFSSHRRFSQVTAALETALDYSIGNLPSLGNRVLVVVDTSGSMDAHVSDKSEISYVQIGTLFGAAMARANTGDTVCFGTHAKKVPVNRSNSVLSIQAALSNENLRNQLGYGTNMSTAFAQVNVNDYDTVVVFSDMQIHDQVRSALKGYSGSVYTVNLAAYEAQMEKVADKQFAIGGWSDTTLKMMELLRSGSLVKYIESYE